LLRQSILKRSDKDLSPVSEKTVPEEVQPLIEAINVLLKRSRDEIESRKWFVANAAHQLRTPIAGLKTYSSMGYGLKTLNDFRHVMDKLDTGLDRVTHLVNQLLALARVEHGSLSPVDLNDIVSGAAAELLDLSLEKGVDLEYLHSPNSAIVNGNTTDLWLLTSNLLENAIRYSSPKGRVTVSLCSVNGCVSLRVEDNGQGIPVEERERVYERFYSLPGSNGNGCGLGLSIVKEVVLAHNASITIDTPPVGFGTLVTVVFPQLR
jgi:two-component system sensor histidine kinase TctE